MAKEIQSSSQKIKYFMKFQRKKAFDKKIFKYEVVYILVYVYNIYIIYIILYTLFKKLL